MLSFIIFLPLVGALLVLLAGGRGDNHEREPLVRTIALATSLVTFVATLVLWWRFDPTVAAYQFEERHAWIPVFGIQYYLGVDGISLLLIVLTGFLTPLALLSSWESVHKSVKAFSFFMLALETAMLGRVRLDRSLPLLHLLGRDAHPDVLPHRGLGLRATHLRRGQVHPLHDGRERPDAHRHHRAGLGAPGGDRLSQLQPARSVQRPVRRRRPRPGSSWHSRWRS